MILRGHFQKWKGIINELGDKVGKFLEEEDEKIVIEASIKVYMNEMLKSSLQMHALCIALSERNERTHETLEETLQNSGLNNLFNLFWSRICQILQTSIKKLSTEKSGAQKLFDSLVKSYPIFYKCLGEFWEGLTDETIPASSKIVFIQ